MLTRQELRQRIGSVALSIDASLVEQALRELEREGENTGGGIDAHRLAYRLLSHLLEVPSLTETEVTWGYPYLRPAVMAAVNQLPGYELVEGD